jgi:hypothetical protein
MRNNWFVGFALLLMGCAGGEGFGLERKLAHFWSSSPADLGLAPETRGISAEGQPLDLVSYRGKVVLLHFWHST